MKHLTLEERVWKREKKHKSIRLAPSLHVRAELDRLVRQVRRLERYEPEATNNVFLYYKDVQDLIRKAKR